MPPESLALSAAVALLLVVCLVVVAPVTVVNAVEAEADEVPVEVLEMLWMLVCAQRNVGCLLPCRELVVAGCGWVRQHVHCWAEVALIHTVLLHPQTRPSVCKK